MSNEFDKLKKEMADIVKKNIEIAKAKAAKIGRPVTVHHSKEYLIKGSIPDPSISDQEYVPNLEKVLDHYKNDILVLRNQNRLDDFLDEIFYPQNRSISVNDIEDIQYNNGNIEIIFIDGYNHKSRSEYSKPGKDISGGYRVQLSRYETSNVIESSTSDSVKTDNNLYWGHIDSSVFLNDGDKVSEKQPANKINSAQRKS